MLTRVFRTELRGLLINYPLLYSLHCFIKLSSKLISQSNGSGYTRIVHCFFPRLKISVSFTQKLKPQQLTGQSNPPQRYLQEWETGKSMYYCQNLWTHTTRWLSTRHCVQKLRKIPFKHWIELSGQITKPLNLEWGMILIAPTEKTLRAWNIYIWVVNTTWNYNGLPWKIHHSIH